MSHTVPCYGLTPLGVDDEWHSWREIIEFLGETIDSLRRDGSLNTDALLERAHQLLTALAGAPIESAKATEMLHRLRDG
jgi:hypothetical protein